MAVTREQVLAAYAANPLAEARPSEQAIQYWQNAGLGSFNQTVDAVRAANPVLAAQIDTQRAATPTVTNAQVASYLANNPGLSDAEIAQTMAQFNVTPAQMAAVTGIPESQVVSRVAAVTPAPAAPTPAAPPPAPTQSVTERLTNQILSQGTTNQWSGEGFGSTTANAKAMAKVLEKNGITDINQFGQQAVKEARTFIPETQIVGWLGQSRTPTNPNNTIQPDFDGEGNIVGYYEAAPTGRVYENVPILDGEGNAAGTERNFLAPQQVQALGLTGNTPQTVMVPTDKTEFVNKATGKPIDAEYAFADGNIWSGTFAGKDSTAFGVQFDQQGNPLFYTTQGRGSSDRATFGTLASLALMTVPGLQGLGASIGSTIAPGLAAGTQALIGNAIVQGALTEAQGGKFLEGAALSGASSLLPGVNSTISNALGGGTAANIAAGALTSGVLSELAGTGFKQGALTGAIGAGINDARLTAADEYLNSLPGGQGLYTDELPDMSDFDLPSTVIDTSFTPDYSLSTGAPVIPGMGGQGIQVPTINEVVDVVNQPVDYSLPIPGSGLGLQMPTVPNLNSMGGGQGITVPVSGGTLTEAGVIPPDYSFDLGDPNSFINQPAPSGSITLPVSIPTSPTNIDTKLGLLDVAKVVLPIVGGSLLNNAVNQPSGGSPTQTGFPILPVPGEFGTPTYGQGYRPSAPIDFGSRAMLQGTQFANPPQSASPSFYNLSDVINALNFQSVPFTQQQTQMPQFQAPVNTGMDNIIGEINGLPMSLNSIIAGIQSQYGQKT